MTAEAHAHDLSPRTDDLSPRTAHPAAAPARDLSPRTSTTARDLSPRTSRPAAAPARDLSPRTARPARRLPPPSLALAAVLAACAPAPALPGAADGPPAPLALAAGTPVAYVLDWSWDDARRDGDAHVFTTDRGYTVTLETAYLATGRAELVPCPQQRGLAGAVSSLLVRTAHAAHSRVGDTSAVAAPVVEPAHHARPHLFGRAFASGDAYCGLHLLGVPVSAEAADGFALARESLVLTGHWTAPGSDERHPLHASINLQDGSTRPFTDWTEFPTDLAPASARVAVVATRHPTRAFDRLDLAHINDTDLAFAVLGNLLQTTEVHVATRP